MNNFNYFNPVRIVFGKNSIAQLSSLIPAQQKVLVLYGGGSVLRNGVMDQVRQALKGYSLIEFGGIEPNPKYETCMKAVEICRGQSVQFLLAVGGGSVLDGTKFIAAAVPFQGQDPWDILAKGAAVESALPLGCVLTLPATGSEMNSGSVVSRNSTEEKLYFGSDFVYPKFSILDPETTFSLPPRQTANGIVDIFVHVLEQYATSFADAPLQDLQAESILKVLIQEAPKLRANPKDYNARANVMWCATQALNGNIGQGVMQDWSTHGIGHEITAFYGLDHAQTLAIIWPGVAKACMETKRAKLAEYGRRIWGLTGPDATVAEQSILKTESFFESVGCPTHLSAYSLDAKQVAAKVAERFKQRGMTGMGDGGVITPDRIREIIESRQ